MNCSGQVENSLELALVSHAETEHQHLHLRPLHDKATLIAFASLAAWSWFVFSFGASLGILREEQGTSPMIGGLHGTALAVGGILGALATPRLNQKFGRGLVMRISTAGVVVGILIFTIPGVTVVGTLVGAFIACFFGNPIVVCVNSFIVTHQGPASAPALTESTALAALMGVLAPVFLGISIASVLGWRAGSWAAVIAFVFIEIWPAHLPRAAAQADGAHHQRRQGRAAGRAVGAFVPVGRRGGPAVGVFGVRRAAATHLLGPHRQYVLHRRGVLHEPVGR